ncbi:MAG: hypothetical protein HN909_06725, partial [Phycisphaerales bacterium]|nr:hypothetical protein [Phycisphaerales bacterium]
QEADSPSKPYTQVNRKYMVMSLLEWEMGPLIDRFVEVTNDPDLRLSLLKKKVARADLATPEGQTLVQEIKDTLDKKIAGLDQQQKSTTKEIAKLGLIRELNRARCEKIDFLGPQLAKNYLNRVLFLRGTVEDRAALGKLQDTAIKLLLEQEAILTDEEDLCAGKTLRTALLLRSLRDMRAWMSYAGSSMYLYKAMSMDEGDKTESGQSRSDILALALERIQPFAKEKKHARIPWGRLARGRIFRMLGHYAKADEDLRWVVSQTEAPAIRVEGAFESARNTAEWAIHLATSKKMAEAKETFADAIEAISTARKIEARLPIQMAGFYADAKRLSLTMHLFTRWQAALKVAGAEVALTKAGAEFQTALIAIFNRYNIANKPDLSGKAKDNLVQMQQALVSLLESKYDVDSINPQTAPPVIVSLLAKAKLARARFEFHNVGKATMTAPAQKLFDQTKRLYGGLEGRIDESMKPIEADIYWGLGRVAQYTGKNADAMKYFRTLAANCSKSPIALRAALLCMKMTDLLIERNDSVEHRLEKAKALEVMLTISAGKPELMGYNINLGETYVILSERVDGEKVSYIQKAVTAFKKVPATDPFYAAAFYRLLDLEYKMLIESDMSDDAIIRDLQERMLTYGLTCKAKRDRTTEPKADEPSKEELSEWGSQIEFHALVLSYDYLSMGNVEVKDEAMANIKGLSDRWPGTQILQQSETYFIRKLLAEGKIEAAFQRVEKFRKDYSEEAAESLMTQVSVALRNQIEILSLKGESPALTSARQAFLSLGERIYKSLPANVDEVKKIGVMKLYIDALLNSNAQENVTKAMTILGELKSAEDAKAAIFRKAVAAKLAPQIQSAKNATTPRAAKELLAELDKTVEGYKLQDFRFNNRFLAKTLTDELNGMLATKKATPEELATTTQGIRTQILKCYDQLQTHLQKGTTIDANVLRMRAKGFYLLKDYTKALPLYYRLIQGLDRSTTLYWKSEYEYAKCFYEVNKADPQKLKPWLQRLDQLRNGSSAQGGYKGHFNVIERKFKTAIEKK